MILRVSTTVLESFRLYMTGDWMDEAELLATIRGEFTPSHEIELGQAYGKVIEKPGPHAVDGGYACNDFFFNEATMQPALELFDRSGVFEAKATKQYGDLLVVSKVDHVHGCRIQEAKTTLGSFDHEKYAESCQWRLYLDAFEAAAVTYHVFCLGEGKRTGEVRLKSIESFDLFPYAQLRQDLDALLRQFRSYVRLRKLEGLLADRQLAAESGVYR